MPAMDNASLWVIGCPKGLPVPTIAALDRLGGDAAKTALEGMLANKAEDGAIRALAFRSLRRVERHTSFR